MQQPKLKLLKIFTFFLSLTLCSCATQTSLQGQWDLLVSKKIYPTEISYIASEEIMINSAFADINGKYQEKNNQLILIQSAQPRISGIVFEKQNERTWVITKAPAAARLTTPLFGASMTKH